jgi:hypothetical protein
MHTRDWAMNETLGRFTEMVSSVAGLNDGFYVERHGLVTTDDSLSEIK